MRHLDEQQPLIIAGVSSIEGIHFLIIEVAAGGYVQDVICKPYEDAVTALEHIKEAAKVHGDGDTCELWADNSEILKHSLSVVGVNAIVKHSSYIQSVVNGHLERHKDLLTEFHELTDENNEEDPVILSKWRAFAIKLLSKLRDSADRLIQRIKSTGGTE